MTCPECDGAGTVERVNWNGFYEVPCAYCWQSLGEVPDDDSNDSARTAPGNNG